MHTIIYELVQLDFVFFYFLQPHINLEILVSPKGLQMFSSKRHMSYFLLLPYSQGVSTVASSTCLIWQNFYFCFAPDAFSDGTQRDLRLFPGSNWRAFSARQMCKPFQYGVTFLLAE